jgi:uncharacterized membrane protein
VKDLINKESSAIAEQINRKTDVSNLVIKNLASYIIENKDHINSNSEVVNILKNSDKISKKILEDRNVNFSGIYLFLAKGNISFSKLGIVNNENFTKINDLLKSNKARLVFSHSEREEAFFLSRAVFDKNSYIGSIHVLIDKSFFTIRRDQNIFDINYIFSFDKDLVFNNNIKNNELRKQYKFNIFNKFITSEQISFFDNKVRLKLILDAQKYRDNYVKEMILKIIIFNSIMVILVFCVKRIIKNTVENKYRLLLSDIDEIKKENELLIVENMVLDNNNKDLETYIESVSNKETNEIDFIKPILHNIEQRLTEVKSYSVLLLNSILNDQNESSSDYLKLELVEKIVKKINEINSPNLRHIEEEIDIKENITAVTNIFLKALLDKNIDANIKFIGDLSSIFIDPSSVKMLLSSLLCNQIMKLGNAAKIKITIKKILKKKIPYLLIKIEDDLPSFAHINIESLIPSENNYLCGVVCLFVPSFLKIKESLTNFGGIIEQQEVEYGNVLNVFIPATEIDKSDQSTVLAYNNNDNKIVFLYPKNSK